MNSLFTMNEFIYKILTHVTYCPLNKKYGKGLIKILLDGAIKADDC